MPFTRCQGSNTDQLCVTRACTCRKRCRFNLKPPLFARLRAMKTPSGHWLPASIPWVTSRASCCGYPYWDDELKQVLSVPKALGAMAAHRSSGVVVDSYLEDGQSGLFMDLRSIVGWSQVEHHLLETPCGGLTEDPFERAALFRAHELKGPGRLSATATCTGAPSDTWHRPLAISHFSPTTPM